MAIREVQIAGTWREGKQKTNLRNAESRLRQLCKQLLGGNNNEDVQSNSIYGGGNSSRAAHSNEHLRMFGGLT